MKNLKQSLSSKQMTIVLIIVWLDEEAANLIVSKETVLIKLFIRFE